jgi:hypothetical protein
MTNWRPRWRTSPEPQCTIPLPLQYDSRWCPAFLHLCDEQNRTIAQLLCYLDAARANLSRVKQHANLDQPADGGGSRGLWPAHPCGSPFIVVRTVRTVCVGSALDRNMRCFAIDSAARERREG